MTCAVSYFRIHHFEQSKPYFEPFTIVIRCLLKLEYFDWFCVDIILIDCIDFVCLRFRRIFAQLRVRLWHAFNQAIRSFVFLYREL